MELRQLLEILWRRRRLCGGIALGVFLGILLLTLLVVPRYVATSKVLAYKSPSASTLLSSLGLRSSTMPETVSDAEVANYKLIAQSAPVLQAVTQELELQRVRARSLLPRMIPGATWLLPKLGLDGLLNATKPLQWDELGKKSILQFFFPRPYVDISEDQDADIFTITVQATDMAESVRIANTVAKAFIDRDVELQREEFYRFADSIEARIPLAKAEYERTLKGLQDFREKHASISLDEEILRLIGLISSVASERDEAGVQAEQYRAMLAETRRLLAATPQYSKSQEQMERNPVVDSVKLTLRDLYLELANTRTRYTEQHPQVVDIQNRIKQAKEIIQEEAARIFGDVTLALDPLFTELAQRASQYAADTAGAEMQQQAYDQVLASLNQKLLRFPAMQTNYALLSLQYRRAEQYLQTLMDINYQVDTARSLAVSNLRLVEAASIPPDITDYKQPNLMLHVALAIFLAGFFSLVGTFLREYLDPAVLRPDDAATAAGAPCLAVLPAGSGTRQGAFASRPAGHPQREALSALAATLESGNPVPRRIGLLPLNDEPATALAVAHLGQMQTEERHRTLLVDLCLRTPHLDALFGVARSPGVAEVLAGKATAQACLQPLPFEQARLLAAGRADLLQGTVLSKRALEPLLNSLAAQVDRTVCLLPALATNADGLRIVSVLNTVVLVASQGVTHREALSNAAAGVRQAGGTVQGVVLIQESGWKAFPQLQWKRA
ncbi:GumC family protein [Megalodesulfovibrio gigas]|uniref:Putative polysaccharide biosynthesis protein n=1 Tax=Megalodesulfovibrio gigas (strain ATCC 19364 / DSM 1382 / NCIMB 9332 / VKM B-1759) TaxID=1121448 RepID=T2GFJ7_MEGG1|nr:polysaccharide biosynthesis protein [Megalodesulfovibrio gigas]AGW14677.1 putative polysaccharide biosynthesis protein [Megalodesulfovibrio gigas DSM 1382 = ATCC 19364]